MKKTCDIHGGFFTLIWRGNAAVPMDRWRGPADEIPLDHCPPCPDSCGLCGAHVQDTCCVVLELTRRCNLNCVFCFAGRNEPGLRHPAASKPVGPVEGPADPSLDTVRQWLRFLADRGGSFVHLSGGEPTLREDLPAIIRFAKARGFEYIQLNTNGLKLAEDEAYVQTLAEAGVSFVFLQFDGTEEDIYRQLRGGPLLEQKLRAIEHCGRHNVGVALVCTLVPHVNTHNIGALLRLAASLSPMVRGVHFQPVSYFGRYPAPPADEARFTLPELVRAIEDQTGGGIPARALLPSQCDHPMCGLHGDFIVMPDGFYPLTGLSGAQTSDAPDESVCCRAPFPSLSAAAAERSRNFIGRRWKRQSPGCCANDPANEQGGDISVDITTLDGFLDRVRSHGFTITAMAFQDCYNLDLERLCHCSLHTYDGERIMPLCLRYLTPEIP
jgi:uncharacterized radical SAM superfamily Fe-S cluster-containing enzyme